MVQHFLDKTITLDSEKDQHKKSEFIYVDVQGIEIYNHLIEKGFPKNILDKIFENQHEHWNDLPYWIENLIHILNLADIKTVSVVKTPFADMIGDTDLVMVEQANDTTFTMEMSEFERQFGDVIDIW